MKKTLLLSLLVAASTMLTAQAGIVTLTTHGPNGGGEITAIASLGGTFQTFCLEKSESSSLNTPYDAWSSQKTVATGYQLNEGTAWLYKQFVYGTLPGYDHSAAAQESLQNEIWYLMGGQNPSPDNTLGFDTLVNTKFGSHAGATADNTDIGMTGVWVINVYGLHTLNSDGIGVGNHQDLLWTPGVPGVPDGGLTIALLGMGLTGIGAISRRVRK